MHSQAQSACPSRWQERLSCWLLPLLAHFSMQTHRLRTYQLHQVGLTASCLWAGYAGYPSDLAGADTIAAIEPFTEPCSTAGQPEPWPVPAADQPAIEHRPLPVPKLRTVQRSTSDLQDFRISSNLGKYVERRLSHVSSSTNKPLNPRRASDSAEPSKTLHKHKPSDPLTIHKSVLQRIESLGPVSAHDDLAIKQAVLSAMLRIGGMPDSLWFPLCICP